MEGPAGGVGAQALDASAAPFAIRRVDSFGAVPARIGENSLAQCEHDRDREVGRTVIDERRINVRDGNATLFACELNTRLRRQVQRFVGGLGVTSALSEL